MPANTGAGPAAARNIGWRNAKGQIVAFTDDDCIASPNWLLEGYNAFSNDRAAVSGKIKVLLPDKPTEYERCICRLETTNFTTANCFYRKSVLEETGGFDDRFTMAWREDIDLFFEILKKGFKFKITDKAVITHNARKAPWGVSIRENKKNMYNALLFKKHPFLFRKIIEPQLPYLHYATIFSAFTGTFGVFISAWFAAFIYVWIFLWLWFTFNRLKYTSKSFSHILEMLFTSIIIPFYSVYWRITGGLRFKVIYF